MKRLTKKQIILLHNSIIENTGGIVGIRDENLIDSAINAPFQTFDGRDIYSSALSKAARLGFGIIKNHAFIDGNKRIGAHVMLVFLEINGIELEYKQKELIDIILGVADGTVSSEELLNWIKEHQ